MRTFHAGGIAHNIADITLGLPRVEALFEARIPQRAAVLADRDGKVSRIERDPDTGRMRLSTTSTTILQDDYSLPEGYALLVRLNEQVKVGQVMARSSETRNDDRSGILRARIAGEVTAIKDRHLTLCGEACEERVYDLPPGCTLMVNEGQMVTIGTPLGGGSLNPHELLRLAGQDATQRYLMYEVQRVYRGTGVFIHDKHLEVILRQMFRAVVVSQRGDSTLFPGQMLDRFEYLHHVAMLLAQGGQPPSARPLLLGLTKTVLQTSSWIAAASFQDTSRVLAHAAIRHQQDDVLGLKERVVVGRKIPERR